MLKLFKRSASNLTKRKVNVRFQKHHSHGSQDFLLHKCISQNSRHKFIKPITKVHALLLSAGTEYRVRSAIAITTSAALPLVALFLLVQIIIHDV